MTEAVVTLRIKGDSAGGVAAVNGAQAALAKVAPVAKQAGDAAKKAGRDAATASEGWDKFKAGIAGAGLVVGVALVARMSDAMAGLDARLKITARTTEEYGNANGIVLRIAQETRQSLESTGQLYVRLTTALKDTGASQLEVATLTTTINQAFAVSGASAAEAAAAITQLSQGLAAGALRGDEFNSVAEQAPRLMDALAKSLGVSRGELRKMAEDGKLTADVIRKALAEASGDIGAEFAQLPVTIGGGLTAIQNSVASLVGWFTRQTGAGNAIGKFFVEIAGFIEALPAVAIGVIGSFEVWWEQLKALFSAGGVELKRAIMEPIGQVIRGLQLSLATIAQAVANLPGGLGDELALGIGKAIGALNGYIFTSGEYRAELDAVAAARDEAIAGIERKIAAAQEEFATEQAGIASAQEYENKTRAGNAARGKAIDLTKQWAAAERELYSQRRPLLEQFGEELQARRELQTMLQEMDASLDNEIALAGMSSEQRRRHVNAMQAEEFAREVLLASQRAGGELSAEEIELIRQSTEARLNYADATAEATALQEEANQSLADFAGSYLNQASDAIGDFVANGMKGWTSLWQSFKDIARRALAEFIGNLARQRIVVPILAQITGQSSGVAGAAANAFGGGGGGILGSVAGIASGIGSVAGALGFSGFAAGATVAGSAGFMAATQFGFASLAAGNLGVGFGALLGPIGLVVGALALLHSVMKDTTRRITVIGSELVGTAGYRNLAPDAVRESALGGFAFASIDNVSREERDQLAGAIQQFDAAIAGMLDADQLAAVRAAVAAINTSAEEGAITAETFIQRRFDAVLNSMTQSVQDFVREGGTLEEQMERLATALRRPAEIDAVMASLERTELLAGMTELERQTLAVNEQFDAAIAYLTEREASEEQLARVEELRTNALNRLNAAQDEVLENEEELIRDAQGIARTLGELRFEESLVGLSDLDRQLAVLARQFDEAVEAARLMGATEEEIAEIRAIGAARARRLIDAEAAYVSGTQSAGEIANQQMAEAAERAREIAESFRSIVDFLNEEQFSATSTLTPQERLSAAQGQFTDLLARAAGGDATAAQGIAGAAQRLLEEALSFYGGGDQFRQIRDAVRAALGPLAAFGQSGSSDLSSVQDRLRAALAMFQSMTGGGIGTIPGAAGFNAANTPFVAGAPGSAVGQVTAGNDPGNPYARLEGRLSAVETAVRAKGDETVAALNRLASGGARFG